MKILMALIACKYDEKGAGERTQDFRKFVFILAFVTDLGILDFGEQLLSLEPPLSESDYTFSLGTKEGLSDLFDFNF